MKSRYYFAKIFFLLFTGILFIESVFKLISFNTLFDFSYIRIMLFTFVISMFLSLIYSFFKEKVVKYLILTTLFLFGLYAILQIGFFSFMGNYMSLSAGEAGGRVTEFIGDFMKVLKWNYFLVFLPTIGYAILLIWKKHYLLYKKLSARRILAAVVVIILVHFVSILSLNISSKTQLSTNKELYKNPNLLTIALKQFGTVRFVWLDIKNIVMPSSNDLSIDVDDKEEEVVTDYSRKIDDTAWKALMAGRTDNTIKTLDEYYMNKSITPKNEMTGVFEGKNLILIMVEAFDQAAIDPVLTPTLYKLSQEGWYFDNFRSPEYSCATGESEYIGLNSIVPLNTTCAPFEYIDNNYTTSIFNVFNGGGYYSSSYHNWTDEYYPRTRLHKNMGSDRFYNRDPLDITIIPGWPSDIELMKNAYPYFKDKDKYFSFIITSSMHFRYTEVTGVVKKNWSLVQNLDYPDKMKNYLSKSIEFDNSMKLLLQQLTDDGTLKDTVIVLYGDHHPLGSLPISSLTARSTVDRTVDFNLSLRPFIIYNSEATPKVYHDVASTFDILPTLANLFNLNYDPRYYVGKDIFSTEEQVVIYPNGSWVTEKAMYFSSTGTFKITDPSVDETYITATNAKVKDIIYTSNTTLTKDYFSYRFAE